MTSTWWFRLRLYVFYFLEWYISLRSSSCMAARLTGCTEIWTVKLRFRCSRCANDERVWLIVGLCSMLRIPTLNVKLSVYSKTSIWASWRYIIQPFHYSGVLLEVAFNQRVALYFSTSWLELWKDKFDCWKQKQLTQLTFNEEKTSTVTQLLVSNQIFTRENQVTRRCCSRPRHFCAGVDILVNYYWAIITLRRKKPFITN